MVHTVFWVIYVCVVSYTSYFSSIPFSCSVMSDSLRPMDCSTPGLPVHHQLPELTQTHVHRVGGAIQSSHPLLCPSPAFSLSQHQGLFRRVSSSHQVARVLEFQLHLVAFSLFYFPQKTHRKASAFLHWVCRNQIEKLISIIDLSNIYEFRLLISYWMMLACFKRELTLHHMFNVPRIHSMALFCYYSHSLI